MKRLALLLAGTAMPLALFAAPDFTSRAVAQTPPSIEMMLEEAGLDAQALERLERALTEVQDEARALRERADELADRAATSAAQAEDAREDYEALADDPDADPDEIEAARADAEDAETQAREDAQAAAEAREAVQTVEAELGALRETYETAQREAQQIRERAAEAEREAEAAAAAEREAEEREATAEAQREAEREAEAAAEAEREAEREAEARREAEAEAAAEAEREAAAEAAAEVEAEREAEAEAEARRETEAEREVDREARRETGEPRRREAAQASEAPSDTAPEAAPQSAPAPAEEIAAPSEPQNFGEVREGRRSRVEEGVTITEEPGARTIIQEGERLIIRQAEDERVRRTYSDVRRERRDDQEILVAPRRGRDGDVEIVTILDSDGNLLRRIRREADGTETVLIDNTRRERGDRDRRGEWRGDGRDERRADRRDDWREERRRGERRDERGEGLRFGYDGGAFSFRIDIPPPVVRMPRERYVVEYGDVYEDELAEIFSAPPVAEINDRFTLDEVRYNPNLRDYMARVDLDTVTFDTGSWSLSPRQIEQLGRAARAMNRVIDDNPDEIFLIEGHTDAVGRAIDNLSLSDRRAESVAYILTRIYDVPPENLVTQGYGEEFLKIDTQAAERRNRRVTIRRITPLIAQGPRG